MNMGRKNEGMKRKKEEVAVSWIVTKVTKKESGDGTTTRQSMSKRYKCERNVYEKDTKIFFKKMDFRIQEHRKIV